MWPNEVVAFSATYGAWRGCARGGRRLGGPQPLTARTAAQDRGPAAPRRSYLSKLDGNLKRQLIDPDRLLCRMF